MYKPPQQRSQSRIPTTAPKASHNQQATGSFRVQPQLENSQTPPETQKYSPELADLLAAKMTSTTRQPAAPVSPIQTKLTVGAPGDKYEQEADSMASRVMSISDSAVQRQRALGTQIQPQVQARFVQRAPDRNVLAGGKIENQLQSSQGGGSPLSEQIRAYMEPRLGADFSRVRVHTGEQAVQMNRELGAQAFTHGSNIYYGAGKSPGVNELTAHELTHVVQQTGALSYGQNINQTRLQNKEESVPLVTKIQHNVIAPCIQRWVFPTDWLDYIGLGIDVVERIYIELGYEEGQEKDFQRFINTLFLAIDVVFAATPGAGGGGVALRASHSGAVAAWAITPDSIKLKVAQEVAKRMGWSVTRALQMANIYFSASQTSGSEKDRPWKEDAYHGQKPEYENPGHHDPSSSNFRGGGSKTTQLPPDAEEVYKNAIPEKDGKTWWGRNSQGEYYRYQGSNGKVHWNGREQSGRGLKVPNYIKKRFENLIKDRMGR